MPFRTIALNFFSMLCIVTCTAELSAQRSMLETVAYPGRYNESRALPEGVELLDEVTSSDISVIQPSQDSVVSVISAVPVNQAGTTAGWVDQLNSPGLSQSQLSGSHFELMSAVGDGQYWWDVGLAARGYFSKDQRIEFTGQEATFGVEGIVRAEAGTRRDDSFGFIYGEFFLNQPFDSNLLKDYALRESFSHNFEVDIFEISQLSMTIQRGDLAFEIGRFVSPFGRYYGISTQNAIADVPFIRSEAILFRETGAQLRWNPGTLRSTLAITNGGPERDTNSSKAMIARVGFDLERTSFGGSVKWQDGIGSEGQKEYKRHAGADFMFRISETLIFSTEFIYDEYGLRRPGYSLDDIDWGRSLYNRQLNNGLNNPLKGWGYYANLIGRRPCFDWMLSYGQYLPDQIGDPIHDAGTTRGIGQVAWHLSPMAELYGTVLIENTVENAQAGRTRKGLMFASGLQFQF